MRLACFALFASLAFGQVQTFSGVNGIGHGSIVSVDRDGDGYGPGPIAIIQTTAGGSISVGTAKTITPASMSGTIGATTTNGSNLLTALTDQNRALQVGEAISGTGIPANTTVSFIYGGTNNEWVQISNNATASGSVSLTVTIAPGTVLRVDLGMNMERVQVASVTATTFTATFLIAHASGCSILDQGVIGPDADDLDPTVWTYNQVATKYESGTVGSLPNFRKKLANDIIQENAFAQDVNLSASAAKAMTAAVAAGLTSPTHIWYFGTSGAASPFGASSDSNTCASLASPCLTFGAAAFSSYTSGDLVFLGPNANLRMTPAAGTSSKHSTIMAYPGVRTLIDPTIVSGAIAQTLDTGYLTFIGMHWQNGAQINGGTTPGNSPDSNNVYVWGNDMYNCGANACVNAFQAVNNWVIEDNVMAANTVQHGIYMGAYPFYNSGQYASTGLVVRRNRMYLNNYSGIHFNGAMTYGVIDQNVFTDNGSNSISLQNGWSYGFVRGNLLSGAGYGPGDMAYDMQFYNYQGNCGDATAGNLQYLCPSNQNHNLVANNTFYNTSTGFGAIQIQSDTNGCVVTASTCPSPALQGDLGNNTYRNNIFVGYGNTNVTSLPYHFPPINFANCTPGTSAYFNGSTTYAYIGPCLFNTSDTYLPTSTFDHNIVFELGPYADTNAIGWGPQASDGSKYTSHGQTQGNGYFPLTWAAAATAGATVTGGLQGDPKFASASLSYTNPMQYDFRLLNSSPALNTGSSTATPLYDVAGRGYTGTTPSLGGLEHNPWVFGWNILSGVTVQSATPADASSCNQSGTLYTTSCDLSGSPYPFNTFGSNLVTAWGSGMAVDKPGAQKLIMAGGGHADYGGSQVLAINLASTTPSISMILNPAFINTATYNTCNYVNADGSPRSKHYFGTMAYIPSIDKVFTYGGGVYCGNGYNYADTWLFNASAATWASQDPTTCPTTCGGSVGNYEQFFTGTNVAATPDNYSAYDPNTGHVFSFLSRVVVGDYNPTNNSFIRAANFGTALGCFTSSGCNGAFVDPQLQNFWIFGGAVAYQWNIAGPTPTYPLAFTDQTSTVSTSGATDCSAILNAQGPGIVWNPALSKMMGYPENSGANVLLFSPSTLGCSTITPAGTAPSSGTNDRGLFGRFGYFPSLDIATLVNDYSVNAAVLSLNAPDPNSGAATGFGGVKISGPVRRAGPVTTQ